MHREYLPAACIHHRSFFHRIRVSNKNQFSLKRSMFERSIKGQLQRFYKLVSYERAVKILKNDICITEIGQAVLEIFEFKLEFLRKISKIRNFANVSIIRVEQ